MNRSALVQLSLAKIRDLLREPEALFWVFAFPLLLALALGIAFRSSGGEELAVGVQPGAPALVETIDDDADLIANGCDICPCDTNVQVCAPAAQSHRVQRCRGTPAAMGRWRAAA